MPSTDTAAKGEDGKRWYALDNSAKIYSGSMSRSWASLYRLSVTLTEPVVPERLQQALEQVLPRFPLFRMSLHRGVFWPYLDETTSVPPRVEPDVANPCKRIDKKENHGYAFRVRYYQNRIALEVFHCLADGSGSLVFLKTLAAQYLRLSGHEIAVGDGVLDLLEPPHPEEMEDSLHRYARFDHIESRREAAAYRPRLTKEPPPTLHLVTGRVPLDRLSAAAKALGVTVTEYLAGQLCYAFYEQQLAEKPRRLKPVKVSIPVNMRRFYPSETLRNFSLFVNPGVDPRYGRYTREEIILQTHHFLRLNLNEKKLNAIMSANVGSEKNPVVRFVPLFIKNWALQFSYWYYGESRYSLAMSNLGAVRVSDSLRPYIRRFDFLIGPQRYLPHAATVIGYGNDVYITLTRTVKESVVERRFFTGLVQSGLPVTVESNDV